MLTERGILPTGYMIGHATSAKELTRQATPQVTARDCIQHWWIDEVLAEA